MTRTKQLLIGVALGIFGTVVAIIQLQSPQAQELIASWKRPRAEMLAGSTLHVEDEDGDPVTLYCTSYGLIRYMFYDLREKQHYGEVDVGGRDGEAIFFQRDVWTNRTSAIIVRCK